MKWVQIVLTLIAGISITLSWPEWLSLILFLVACIFWGLMGYKDGLNDGMDIE